DYYCAIWHSSDNWVF
nr:immunoglobulin light chain junction region [Macaca mulatta]